MASNMALILNVVIICGYAWLKSNIFLFILSMWSVVSILYAADQMEIT